MAKLSESTLQSIRNFGRQDPAAPARRLAQAAPQYKQMGTTDPLARRVGSLFSNLGVDTSYMQTAPERIAAETQGLDLSTIEGQQKALQAELQYVQDPQARRALGLRMMELNKLKVQQEELAVKKVQEQAKQLAAERVAIELEGFNDFTTAELVRTGAITPQQGNARKVEYEKSAAASSAGMDGQLARLRGLGLKDTSLYKQVQQGDYKNVSDSAFANVAQAVLDAQEEEEIIASLNQQGRGDIVEQFKLGMISRSEIGSLLRQPSSTTTYTNKKRMLKDDKVVWVADVQEPNKDEFSGYFDNKTKTWIPVSASDIKEIPSASEKKVSDITRSDLATAATYLSKNSEYEDLSEENKLDLQFKFAFKVQELIDKKEVDTAEEAYTIAFSEYGDLIQSNWWSRNIPLVKAKLKQSEIVSRDATDYINAATKGQ